MAGRQVMQANQMSESGARAGYVWALSQIGESMQLVRIGEGGSETRLTFMPGALEASVTEQELALRVNEIMIKRRSDAGMLFTERVERLWRGIAALLHRLPVSERIAGALACETLEGMRALAEAGGGNRDVEGFLKVNSPTDHGVCMAPILQSLDEWVTVDGGSAVLCLTVNGSPVFPRRTGGVGEIRFEFDEWCRRLTTVVGGD